MPFFGPYSLPLPIFPVKGYRVNGLISFLMILEVPFFLPFPIFIVYHNPR